jgi:hypothetical protein
MNHEQALEIFKAQTKNAAALKSSMRHVHKSINSFLRDGKSSEAISFTKIYALLFCSWAEANFSKLIHTPYGFAPQEIAQIQATKSDGIKLAWKKAVELGLQKLDARRGSFRPNARQKLERLIESYVFEPSIIRNKLAHGQWLIALNRDNTDINREITNDINSIDIIKIDFWIKSHELLSNAMENMIESPKKFFIIDWYQFTIRLEEQIQSAGSRSIATHVQILKAKPRRTQGTSPAR